MLKQRFASKLLFLVLSTFLVLNFNIGRTYATSLEGDLFLKGVYKEYHFGNSINWNLPGIKNPSIQYNYHGMAWLDLALNEYHRTGDIKYVNKAIPLMMSWFAQFPYRSSNNPKYAWNDDSTSQRTYNVSRAYKQWGKFLKASQKEKLRKALNYHAALLAQPDFYIWNQNHGLMQDRALLKYTQTFNDKNNKKYQKIIKERILSYVKGQILSDGVNTEHSPGYMIGIAKLIEESANMFTTLDPKFKNLILSDYVDKMRRYAIQLTKPDGSYPPLGDTFNKYYLYKRWLSDPSYQYISTIGKTGTAPKELDVVFPVGGYAMFRDSWKMNNNSDWVMFTAATHNRSHKHQDDLSFMIWHGGDLFVDSGSGGYDYNGNKLAKYGVSAWSHSVLVSNWQTSSNFSLYNGRPTIDANARKTKIVNFNLSENLVSVTGTQSKMKGITQNRTLTWDKNNDLIEVSDEVLSQNKFDNHMFLFQIAEGVTPIIDQGDIKLYRNSVLTSKIHFSSNNLYQIKIFYGNQNQYFKALNANTGKERFAIGVEFNNINSKLNLTTQIQLYPLE